MKTDPEVGAGVTYDPALAHRGPGGGRTAALAAAAGLGLVLVGIGWAVSSGDDSPPRMEVKAGTNRLVTPAADASLDAYNSPSIVVPSPTSPDSLVVAARLDRPQFSAVVRRSDDAGATWTSTNLPLPAGELRSYAPDLAYDAEGGLYAAFVTLSEPGNNPTGVWLAQSKDDGASFTAPTKVAGPYAYQPRVLVNGNTVHVSFVQASASVEGVTNGFGPPPNPVVVATSTDSGATFGEAAKVSGDRERVGAATPFFGIDGELMVLFQDFGDDAVDFEGKAGSTFDGDFSLVMAHSADDGKTFEEVSVVDDAVKPTDRFNPYTPVYPTVAVSPVGEAPAGDAIYVSWADATKSDWDVFVRRSNDNGATWGKRVQVNTATEGSGTHQYLPTVSVAPTGRVDVAFLDRSEGGKDNVFAAAVLATSFDAGATWRTISVSDKLFDSRVGPQGINPETADFGSRIGLVSQQQRALAVWTDTRSGDEASGRQDIYFAPISIAPEQK